MSLAPGLDDLAGAHGAPLPPQSQAEDVVVEAAGITVLCSGEPEQTLLLTFAGDGTLGAVRRFAGAGRALAALPDGGLAIAGEAARGDLAFVARLFFAAGGEADFGTPGVTGFAALTVLADGSVLAGGADAGAGALVCVAAPDRPLWEQPVAETEAVVGLVALADGGFVAAAAREGSTTALGATQLTAFGPVRSARWSRRLAGEPAAIASLGDDVVVAGHRADAGAAGRRGDVAAVAGADDLAAGRGAGAAGLWLARVGDRGEVVWERSLAHGGEQRRGRAVVATADGGVAIAGDTLHENRRSMLLARLDGDGAPLWARMFDAEYDVARALATTADGGFVLAGSTLTPAGTTTAIVRRLDADGALLWEHVLGG